MIHYLPLIPLLPLVAAGLSALAKRRHRAFAASLAIGSMAGALVLSVVALVDTVRFTGPGMARQVYNFRWFQTGESWVELGWVLDPLAAVMLVMVCFVGLLIFIYSLGYMAHDHNFTRFFCFLSLFAAAMLGLVIANNLLLLFICWELVGLTSYLLIGFWYHKPSAAAAAKKAFITTRIGDLAFLLGMVWLYSRTGSLTFYSQGSGCLEASSLEHLIGQTTWLGLPVVTGIGLLLFIGAVGKSGQVPLHVWLPDAMEGPTPVSALIHAATMVAAGVYLIARVFPLVGVSPPGALGLAAVLQVITWVGAITALFAASIAVAQNDIKRILAYSTVSQLGFMMMGLGTGGVAVGMFHLITHAFFKALLFLGAGSVIHGCHDEQDIHRMGGLRRLMPVTFITYAIGMMALSGVPLAFSGFWSKDGILESAHAWRGSHLPFYLGLVAAFLTAFYMTRQVAFVFLGQHRPSPEHPGAPHESPRVMLVPLVLLAGGSILLGFIGTPAWPWFQAFLNGSSAEVAVRHLFEPAVIQIMITSSIVAMAGIGAGYWLYGRGLGAGSLASDAVERLWPNLFTLLQHKYYVDEAYNWLFVRGTNAWGRLCRWLDDWIWGGAVLVITYGLIGLSWLHRWFDEYVVNLGFDQQCRGLVGGGHLLSRLQNGYIHRYLRLLALGLAVLVLLLTWGCQKA